MCAWYLPKKGVYQEILSLGQYFSIHSRGSWSPYSTYLHLDFYLLFVLICCCNISVQTEKMADRPGKSVFFWEEFHVFCTFQLILVLLMHIEYHFCKKKINLIELFWLQNQHLYKSEAYRRSPLPAMSEKRHSRVICYSLGSLLDNVKSEMCINDTIMAFSIASEYHETHPWVNIDSVKINTSLKMMTEWQLSH